MHFFHFSYCESEFLQYIGTLSIPILNLTLLKAKITNLFCQFNGFSFLVLLFSFSGPSQFVFSKLFLKGKVILKHMKLMNFFPRFFPVFFNFQASFVIFFNMMLLNQSNELIVLLAHILNLLRFAKFHLG